MSSVILPVDEAGDPSRLRPHCAQRRQQLIEAAEQVFLEKGYHTATMDDIARQAGMSKKTIYLVFASKAVLFEALLSARLASFATPIPDDGRPLAVVLVEYLMSMARAALSPRQIALTRLLIAESPRSAEVVQALHAYAAGKGDCALDVWLARQAERGALQLPDPPQAAAMLFGMSIGELLLARLVKADPPPGEREVAQRIELAVQVFLGAFAVPRGPQAHHRPAARLTR